MADTAKYKRRLIQFYSAALYNAHIKGLIGGKLYRGSLKFACVPGLNCYSCPAAVSSCPLGALQNALAARNRPVPYYVIGILMLYALALGRTICSFLCPVGLLQELLDRLPLPKLRKSGFTRALSYLKYAVLALVVILLSLVLGYPAFCKYICPAGTLEGSLALVSNPSNSGMLPMLRHLFANKLMILIVCVASFLFVYRPFCRFLCPLGAIYSLFNKTALFGMRVDADKCVSCGKCVAACKADIRHVGDRECVCCTDCAGVCPTGAIYFSYPFRTVLGKKTSSGKTGSRRFAVAALAVCLAVSLFALVNLSNGGNDGAQEAAIGNPCLEITIPLSDGSTFSSRPAPGRPVVINFWTTWCAPCVKELPEFEKLYLRYRETVTVIGVNAASETGDPFAFWDSGGYSFPLAADDGSVLKAFGNWDILPVTVVLAPDGTIIYNSPGTLDFDALEELLSPYLPPSE